jgi:hypothetical protein
MPLMRSGRDNQQGEHAAAQSLQELAVIPVGHLWPRQRSEVGYSHRDQPLPVESAGLGGRELQARAEHKVSVLG